MSGATKADRDLNYCGGGAVLSAPVRSAGWLSSKGQSAGSKPHKRAVSAWRLTPQAGGSRKRLRQRHRVDFGDLPRM